MDDVEPGDVRVCSEVTPDDRIAAVESASTPPPLFTASGRDLRLRIEANTDDLAAEAYEVLAAAELDELITLLDPVAALV